jgi:hypothetical protein
MEVLQKTLLRSEERKKRVAEEEPVIVVAEILEPVEVRVTVRLVHVDVDVDSLTVVLEGMCEIPSVPPLIEGLLRSQG